MSRWHKFIFLVVAWCLVTTPAKAEPSNRAYFVCRVTEVVHDTTANRFINLHLDLRLENNKVSGIKTAYEDAADIHWRKHDNIKVSGSPNTFVEWSGVIPDNGIIIKGKLVIGKHNISSYTEQLRAKGKEVEKIYSTCWRQI